MLLELEKYYKILGLPNNAPKEEVRKAYRKLVMLYHPDKNPSATARQQFILIKDAYEILTGKKNPPRTTQVYTSSPQRRSQSKGNKSEDERKAEARQRYYEQVVKEHQENEKYFKSLTTGFKWKIMQRLAILGIALNIILTLDLVLPRHFKSDTVEEYSLNLAQSVNRNTVSLIATEKGNKYWVSGMTVYNLVGNYPDLIEQSSWWLHNPVKLTSFEKSSINSYEIHFNFYRYTWLLIIIFFLPLTTMIYKRKTYTFTILYFSALYGSSFVMLALLVTNDRWLHLLTLGFI